MLAEADNEDLRSDNARLQEENNKLKACLTSMGPLQPQYSTTDTPLRALSSFRGREREQEHLQHQSMGYLPATHHHDTQGKLPTDEDMCLTTSRPAPHEPAHKAFSSMELNEPRESHPLYEQFSNSEKTLDEIEGQLFPEFDGTERPRTVRILREEWAERKLKALFFRVNNKLYTYVDDAARQAYRNIHMGVPPPLPPRRTMRMLEGRMGPVLLHNTASKIRKLYTRAAREESHHTPNVQETQDLNSYLHLWNAHKQEKGDLIRIIMKGWRPPTWVAEAAKQKKLALREKGKAQAAQQKGNLLPQHGQLSTTGTQPEKLSITSLGTVPTSYPQSLRDQLVCQSRVKWSHKRPLLTSALVNHQRPSRYPVPRSCVVQPPPLLKGKARASPSPMTTFHQTSHPSLPMPIHGRTSCTNDNWG